MKKHLIAVAVSAAVSAPAMAQNVTISGLLDVGYSSAKAALGTASVSSSATGAVGGWSTNNITFTATEDLGGGLKASGVISSFIDSTSSTQNNTNQASPTSLNTIGGRDRFIALEGGFGKVQFGRFTPAVNGYGSFAAFATNNTAGTTDSGASDLVQGTLGGRTVSTGTSFQGNNAFTPDTTSTLANTHAHMEHQSGVLEFTTPTMNGFNVVLTYIKGKSDHSVEVGADSQVQTGIRVNYAAGPLSVAATTARRKSETEAAAAADNDKAKSDIQWLGASYDLGMVKVFYAYADREDKSTIGTAAESTKSYVKVNNIGVSIPMGAAVFHASMYEGSDKMTTSATDDRDLTGHQVGVKYNLSKRTFAYAVTGKNSDKVKTGATTTDWKNSETKFGLVHSF